jgi:hypothetical protein
MTRDEETALRRKARESRAEVKAMETELSNHNPNWKTRLWRAGHNAVNIGGSAVSAGSMMRTRKWGPLAANTWISGAAILLNPWIDHPLLRVPVEFFTGFANGQVVLKRTGQDG